MNQEVPPGVASRVKRVTGQAADPPVLEQARAQPAIEADSRRVPVEHRPFHAAPAALEREAREVLQQLAADASPAVLVAHEEILEVQPRAAEERGVVRKEQREADGVSIVLREDDFSHGPRTKQRRPQPVLRGDHLVFQLLVDRQLADEPQDGRDIVDVRAADGCRRRLRVEHLGQGYDNARHVRRAELQLGHPYGACCISGHDEAGGGHDAAFTAFRTSPASTRSP